MGRSIVNRLRRIPEPVAVTLAALALLTLLCTHSFIDMTNPASRFLTIEALVERGGFALDEKHVFTDDKLVRDGQYYSSKAPVFSVIGAGLYWPLNRIAGLSLPAADAYHAPNLSVYLIVLALSGGSYFLLLAFCYRFLLLFGVDPRFRVPLLLGLGLGTLYLPFSITLNNHTPAGALLLAAFFYLVRARRRGPDVRSLLLAGALTGLAAVIELPVGLLCLLSFGAYALATMPRRFALLFAAAALPALIAHAGLTAAITGDLLPAQLHPEYGATLPAESLSVWRSLGEGGVAAKHAPLSYALNILIGSHGLFLYSPILILAAFGLGSALRHRPALSDGSPGLRPEAVAVAAVWLGLFLFYVLKVRVFTGSAFGFRWFIAPAPLLYVFLLPLFRPAATRAPAAALHVLLAVSAAIAFLGYVNPWPNPYVRIGGPAAATAVRIEFPLLSNLVTVSGRLSGRR